jgi:hypothetical protein
LAGQIADLDRAVHQSQLVRWSTAVPAKEPQATTLPDLDRLRARAARAQQLRYNLWALQQIHAAESVATWDVYLGRVDAGLLHPAVASLYSSAYDQLMRKQDDPVVRIRVVQTILTTPKVPLSAF